MNPTFDLPLLVFPEVFHVGSINPADRTSASYEGEGLSISIHPADWTRIARLGGNPTWVLRHPDRTPLRFVSWHDLSLSDRDALRQWGQDRGWVEQRQVYRVSWFDDEFDDTLSMDFATEAEAREEAESADSEVEAVAVWRPTAAFPAPRIGTDADPSDALLSLWVAEQRPDIDGVWWDDTYDPLRLSCPRGVLVHDVSRYERVRL